MEENLIIKCSEKEKLTPSENEISLLLDFIFCPFGDTLHCPYIFGQCILIYILILILLPKKALFLHGIQLCLFPQ